VAKKKKSSKKKRKSFLSTILKRLGIAFLVLFLFSLLLPVAYRWINPPITPFMLIRKVQDGSPIQKKWVDLEDISPNMVVCAMAAEDNNFLGHSGFDWGAIQKVIDLRKEGNKKRGGSTISQQTAKNVFLWSGRSWLRKGLESYFTFLIETFWSKRRIMEVYLNVIEMGNGIYGAEKAADIYFHTTAKKLTLRQSALITACYPDPRHRNPAKPTSYLNRRCDAICQLTKHFGKINFSQEQIKAAQERFKAREEKRREKMDGKLLEL
jgi:monofunctional biosynthetic peptidoglycan transglycosylase